MRFLVSFLSFIILGAGFAHARDFGYERLADVISQVYGSQYGVIVPFFEMPDASDTAGQAEGYPGSIWNFAVASGRTRGVVYTHADRYCNPNPVPAPLSGGTARIKNWLYRSEISGGGDFTISGATPTDVIFQLTALDAKYINSYAIEITNTKRYYLPYNKLKHATVQATLLCGPNFSHALTGVIAGDVTIKVFFIAGVSSNLIFNIGSHIKASLRLKAEAKLGESEGNPVLVFTEGQKAFAVRADRLPLR